MGGFGLAEYFCTHPDLYVVFTEEDPDFVPENVEKVVTLHPTLPVDRVTRRKLRMAQDSDDLFVVNVVVWVLVVILTIVALHCPLSRRVVR